MEQNNFRILLRRTVAIPVIALAILAAVLLLETQYLNRSMQWVDHTDEVIGAGQRLIKSITDMESDVRGYLSSGGEEFLPPYDQAKPSSDSEFAALNQLVSDNPAQQARLAHLRSCFDEWLSYEERRIALRRSTHSRLDPSLKGKQLMDSLRAEHDAFIATEEQLRADRVRTARIASRLVTFTCVLLSLAIGVFLAISTRRRIRSLAASFQESLDIAGKNENRLRLALDAGGMATWDLNLKSGDNTWNDEMYRLLGYEPQSTPASQEAWARRVFPEDSPKAEALFRASLEQGVDLRSEYRVLGKDNQIRWVEARGRSERDEKGDILRSYGVVMDITERKQAESALKTTLQRFYLILSNMYSGVLLVTDEGRIEFANQAFCDRFDLEDVPADLVGIGPGEMIEKIKNAYRHPEQTIARIQKIVDRGERVSGEELAMQGGRTYLRDFAPLSVDGKLFGRLWLHTDITERKQAEDELREREVLLRTVTENSRVGLVMLSADRRYLYANDAYAEVLGLSTRDIVGKRVLDVMGHVYDQISPQLDRAFGGERVTYELTIPVRQVEGDEGRNRFYAITYEPLQRHGESNRVIVVVVDITDRKRADDESERLAAIIASSGDAIVSTNLEGVVSSWNRSAERLFDYSAQEIAGQPITLIIPLERRSEEITFLERLRRGDSIDHYETVRMNKRGQRIDVSLTLSPICDASGAVIGVSKSARDITERKRADQALQASEDRYRNLFSSMSEGFCVIEMIFDAQGRPADYRFLQVNSAFERQTGLHDAEGKLMRQLAPEHEEHWFQIYGKVALSGEPARFVNEARALQRWYHVHAYRVGNPELRRVAIVFDDFSDYHRAQQALQASEQRWATTLQSIGDAVISTDAAGRIEFMNEVAQRLTGWSMAEAKGSDLSPVFNIVQEVTRLKPESPVAKVIRLGKVVGLANHTALIRRDGTEIPIEDSGAPIRNQEGKIEGVVLVFHDVSEQRKVEKTLRASDRLATTGRLAATIAHEIHNPLDAVGGLLYLIGQATHEDTTREYASMASQELARTTQMTQQMLSFQREAAKPIPVKIAEVLESVIALYDRKIQSAGINLRQQVHFDGHILALPGELRQMLANLVGNAIEAIGARPGTITLRAYESRDWRRGQTGLRVVVADDGPGIPADIRTSVFEPFFTTKGEGGTGLGLWISSDILRKYDGTMRLRTSTQSQRSGTCFSVFFPFEVKPDIDTQIMNI